MIAVDGVSRSKGSRITESSRPFTLNPCRVPIGDACASVCRGSSFLCLRSGPGWDGSSAGRRIQREAVAVIKNAGGTVSYDWEWNNGNGMLGGKPWAPIWLVDLVGVDFFGHVTVVSLSQMDVDVALSPAGWASHSTTAPPGSAVRRLSTLGCPTSKG